MELLCNGFNDPDDRDPMGPQGISLEGNLRFSDENTRWEGKFNAFMKIDQDLFLLTGFRHISLLMSDLGPNQNSAPTPEHKIDQQNPIRSTRHFC